jgi:esterase/lipase superfamily enzyme
VTPVYFATNRLGLGNPVSDFGIDVNPSGAVTFGRAQVADATATANLLQPLVLDNLSGGTFWQPLCDAIVRAPENHLLVYVHGFDYRFDESVVRAAQLAPWFAAATPPLPSVVLAYCWNSRGHFSLSSYGEDYNRATAAADGFRQFLRALVPLIVAFRAYPGRTRRVTLLAHSMGNHVLCGGLLAALGSNPGQYNPAGPAPLFDCTILAASDERADSLSAGQGLSLAARISRRVCVYYNNQDLPLTDISSCFHHGPRLGMDGPADKPAFGAAPYCFVNCSVASPIDKHGTPLDPQRHQYYRLVPEVRDDMSAVMLGLADATLPNRVFRPAGNYYRLNLRTPNPEIEYHH